MAGRGVRSDAGQEVRTAPRPWSNLARAGSALVLGAWFVTWAARTHEHVLLVVTVVLFPLQAIWFFHLYLRDRRRQRLR